MCAHKRTADDDGDERLLVVVLCSCRRMQIKYGSSLVLACEVPEAAGNNGTHVIAANLPGVCLRRRGGECEVEVETAGQVSCETIG